LLVVPNHRSKNKLFNRELASKESSDGFSVSHMNASDYSSYFHDLADYYNNSRIPTSVMTGAAEIRAEFEREGSWVRECVKELHPTLAKRRVLEIGCGGGRWTQFIADVAEQVVATDPCLRLLERARLLNLPNTEFAECDFLWLEKVEGAFTGACHVNIMNNHFSKSRSRPQRGNRGISLESTIKLEKQKDAEDHDVGVAGSSGKVLR
jgi:SAM-dependent methyltransferase